MHEFLAIVICLLSVLGLYAVFSHLAVLFMPRDHFFLTVDGRGKSAEELSNLLYSGRFLLERIGGCSLDLRVLLEDKDLETAEYLRQNGVAFYFIKE